MNRKLLVLACTATFALAACRQDTPAAPADPATEAATDAAVESAPAATATLVATGPANPDSDFDQRGFAGIFAGVLPCADCPGIDTTLQLDADGSYVLTETYQESGVAPRTSEGTWSAEADGGQIRLDPGSKSEQDRLYAISGDDIVQLGAGGRPIDNGLDYRLARQTGAR